MGFLTFQQNGVDDEPTVAPAVESATPVVVSESLPATTVPPPTLAPTPETETLPIQNSFENDTSLKNWQTIGGCDLKTIPKEGDTIIPDGEQVLQANNARADCLSFFQDMPVAPVVGETYTLSMWVYDPENKLLPGEITIWGLGSQNDNSSGRPFTAYNQWHCYQTTYTVASAETTILRAEIYLFAKENSTYLFDNAHYLLGKDTGCPDQSPPPLHNSSFEQNGYYPWQGVNNCLFWVEEDAILAEDGSGLLKLQKSGDECEGVYQAVNGIFTAGKIYRFRAWVRHPLPGSWSGELLLRSSSDQFATTSFSLNGETDWQCVETAIVFAEEMRGGVRADIRFHTPNDIEYQVDNTLLTPIPSPLP
ncbi:hypothetical protein MNBD_CHLOROFLEXI01-3627 [hydrothermal vent metagenome]|uniref:CBM-cenC domain-containing protein n=1 Tax=hydrothermal vent metagenome TaxID=652676 RepID=A0A3B0V4G5_9ZZZZ